jgi:hypothetical protein
MRNKRKLTAAQAPAAEVSETVENPPQSACARNEISSPAGIARLASEPDPCYCSMHKFLHQWLSRQSRLRDQTDDVAIALIAEVFWALKDGAIGVAVDDSFLTVHMAGRDTVRQALDRLGAAGLFTVLSVPTGSPNIRSAGDSHPIALVELPWSGGDDDGAFANQETA